MEARRLPSGDQVNGVTQSVCPLSTRLALRMEAVVIAEDEADGVGLAPKVCVASAVASAVVSAVATWVEVGAMVAGRAVGKGAADELTTRVPGGLDVG